MNKPCHVCQALVDKIATQDAAARAIRAALDRVNAQLIAKYGRAPAYLVAAIAQADAAGIT